MDNDGQGSLWPGGEDARSVSEMRDGKVPDQIKARVFYWKQHGREMLHVLVPEVSCHQKTTKDEGQQ